MSVNKAILLGNVGRDPDVRHLESGTTTATFSLATTEKYKEEEHTEWHTIVCWRATAEMVEKYVRKGTQLYIEGKIQTRSYTDKEGNTRYTTEIVASSIQFVGRKSDNQSVDRGAELAKQVSQEDPDDLPF